jgi:hypothetical protein
MTDAKNKIEQTIYACIFIKNTKIHYLFIFWYNILIKNLKCDNAEVEPSPDGKVGLVLLLQVYWSSEWLKSTSKIVFQTDYTSIFSFSSKKSWKSFFTLTGCWERQKNI